MVATDNRDTCMTARICGVMLLAATATTAGCACGQWTDGKGTDCWQADQAAVMTAAQEVLTDMGFRIAKCDTRLGLIRTEPLSGAQFFEVWRADSAGCYNAAEANLQSIQRTIEMTFAQTGRHVCVTCDAGVRRLSLPEKQIGGTSGAYAMFTRSSSQLMTTRPYPEQQRHMAWVDMGSDVELAKKILRSISAELARGKGSVR